MPDLKLPDILAAAHPERVQPYLEPFWGAAAAGARVETTRLQAPICYWTVYRCDETGPPPGGSRLVTLKCFFEEAVYQQYVEQLERHYTGRLDDPLHPRGGLLLYPERNGVLWQFPFDPSMPGLYHCQDGEWVAGALCQSPDGPDVGQGAVIPEVRRYNPEVSAILAYRRSQRRRGRRPVLAYGKCAPEDKSGVQYVLMDRLWHSPARAEGRLRVAQPLAFRREAGLLLQAPVQGAPIGGDRNRAIFLDLARHAAVAAAAIHEQEVAFGPERSLQHFVDGRRRDLEEFALTAPAQYATLRLLAAQVEHRARRSSPSPLVLNHGDFKWDQFLEQDGQFSLIDFELFCQAERWLDVGYFCAYLAPPEQADWRDGLVTDLLRTHFLESYAAAAGVDLDLERIALYEALALAIRASVHIEMHQPGWEVRAASLLELGLDRLVNPALKSPPPLPAPRASSR